MANNVLDVVLRISRTGQGEAQALAAEIIGVKNAAQQVAVVAPQAAAGLTQLSNSAGGGMGSFRAAGSELAGISSILGSGPMNPRALLEIGRGFVFMGNSMGFISLSLPGMLGIVGALAAVGFAFNQIENNIAEANKQFDEFIKDAKKAQDAGEKLASMRLEGATPSAQEKNNLIEATQKGIDETLKQLDVLGKKLGALTPPQGLRQSWQNFKDFEESVLGGTHTSDALKKQTQDQIEALSVLLENFRKQMSDLQSLGISEAEKNSIVQTKFTVDAIQRDIDAERQGLAVRKAQRAQDQAEQKTNDVTRLQQDSEDEQAVLKSAVEKLQQIRQTYIDAANQAQAKGEATREKLMNDAAVAAGKELQKIQETGKLDEIKSATEIAKAKLSATEAAAKLQSDLELAAAKSGDQRLLIEKIQFLRERDALEKEWDKQNLPVTREDFENQAQAFAHIQAITDLKIAQAEYKDVVTQTNEKLQELQREMAGVDKTTTEGKEATRGYEAQIKELLANALPALQSLRDKWLALAKAQGIAADPKALDAEIKKYQDLLNRPPPRGEETQVQQLLKSWGDLGKQVDHFGASTLQNVSHAMDTMLMDWITHTGNVKQAFSELARSVISGILQIITQQVLAFAVTKALQAAGMASTTAGAASTAAGLSAAYAVPATLASIASFGAADAAGVAGLAAALMAGVGISAAFAGVGSATSAVGAAEGGPIRGPGSSTSDSIATWLSDGEYVHTAAAHGYYGTGAMDAINQRRIPVEAIHAAMSGRHHAIGGAVTVPAFAGSGFVRGAGSGPINVDVGGPTVMLAIGEKEIEKIAASSAMQQALINHAAKHTVRNARLVHRGSGHRSET